MSTFLQMLTIVPAGIVALMSIPLFLPLRWPAPALWLIKLFVSALSPLLSFTGVLIAIAGLTTGSLFVTACGIYSALIFLIYTFRVTRVLKTWSGFERMAGLHPEKNTHHRGYHVLPSAAVLRTSAILDPRMEQNISFSTIPGTGSKLLCDIWQPPGSVAPSGLAFIYLHGSAWYLLNKDVGTRPFFRHLASQGHVIMDVAYRLAPETDMMGMVHDVKRAIAWMRKNAHTYGVDPNRIVVGGGSAGGHLAMLAAYTACNPQFTPKDLEGDDLSVGAVISLYGPVDLKEMYYHTNQHLTTRPTSGKPKKVAPTQMPEWLIKRMGKDYHRLGFDKDLKNAGALASLLGGHPDECPESYALFSPITHVHPHCPPTLLIHGEHDLMAPVKDARLLYELLTAQRVLTIMHILPQTDHAFDLILPRISPSARTAFYDVDRFMLLQQIISGLRAQRLSDREVIRKQKELRDRAISKSGDNVPEALSKNEKESIKV